VDVRSLFSEFLISTTAFFKLGLIVPARSRLERCEPPLDQFKITIVWNPRLSIGKAEVPRNLAVFRMSGRTSARRTRGLRPKLELHRAIAGRWKYPDNHSLFCEGGGAQEPLLDNRKV